MNLNGVLVPLEEGAVISTFRSTMHYFTYSVIKTGSFQSLDAIRDYTIVELD